MNTMGYAFAYFAWARGKGFADSGTLESYPYAPTWFITFGAYTR